MFLQTIGEADVQQTLQVSCIKQSSLRKTIWISGFKFNAVIQLISKILDTFNENIYMLGIFIDLSKAFDTVDHVILLKKFDIYGIKGKSLKGFHSFLTSRE